jgi:CBS domain containing-hemolysin-like protein
MTPEENPAAATTDDAKKPEPGAQSASANLPAVIAPETVAPDDEPRGWLAWLFGFRRRQGADVREKLEGVLAGDIAGTQAFSADERRMLNNILRLKDVRVEDLMVPRTDIEAVEKHILLGDLLKLFEKSGHSRMPVYSDNLDDPQGMVHIRDVVAHITRSAAPPKPNARRKARPGALELRGVALDQPLSDLKLVRKALFVPPSMAAVTLLQRMQASHIQMALVIDEYGGTEGLVSLEDIVEVIVGDIEDEHDADEGPLIAELGDGRFLIDAKAEIADVAAEVGGDFAPGGAESGIDTIGGLVISLAGHVPVRGEVVEGLGFEFRIVDSDPRRVKRIELAPAKRRRPRKGNEPPPAAP